MQRALYKELWPPKVPQGSERWVLFSYPPGQQLSPVPKGKCGQPRSHRPIGPLPQGPSQEQPFAPACSWFTGSTDQHRAQMLSLQRHGGLEARGCVSSSGGGERSVFLFS